MDLSEENARWSLTDLVRDPIQSTLDEYLLIIEQEVSGLEDMRSEMTPEISQETFAEIVEKLELINSLMSRVQSYTFLWFSQDTQNQDALNLRDRLDQSLVNFNNRILFFEIWFKDLPDEAAQRLIAQSGDVRYALESIRRLKPYTLSEIEERLLNLKDVNGIDALVGLYDMITNRLTFKITVDGEEKILTRDELSGYYFDPSADLRVAAYNELYKVYAENSTLLAQIYSHRIRDWHTEGMELRGYSSPISARNLRNDLPDEAVEMLLDVCRRNSTIFQRYFRLKAGWLGMERLRRYDIYAPITQAEKEFDFAQAKEWVMASFSEFSPHMAKLAQRVFDEHHIDPYPHSGKRGGAFCSAVLPELTPWVLLNFSGRADDIATLAHELGHAIHGMLAADHSVLTYHPSLPLAETASIFAEMLLTDKLLREEVDPSVRRDLLVRTIDSAFITVMRQAFFTRFERDAHQMIVEGCSFDDLATHYMTNLKEQFGDSVELSDEFKWEWITIPHLYHEPFYTYAYSFGQLLVLALYQQYRLEGTDFLSRYLKILSYGGAESPVKILKEAGLDISGASFWQAGFDMLDEMITELAKINIGG